MEKYILTEETKKLTDNKILYRIQAIRGFGNVNPGDLGGWIEKEGNLSHVGDCWVYTDAKVYDNAQVCGDAKVYGNAQVYGNAMVCGNAWIYGSALIYDKALVCGDARVSGDAIVRDHARVYDKALIYENARVYEDGWVYGNAQVCGNAHVCGDANVSGNATITENAIIKHMSDYTVFKNTWSSGRWFTWTRSNNMWRVGCFYGTGEELIKKAYSENEETGRCYEICVNMVQQLFHETCSNDN